MLFFPPAKFRKRPHGVGKLTFELVSATYVSGSSITLKFNQPIDISQIQSPEITVNDQPGNLALVGVDGPATRVDPFTVSIELETEGPSTGGVGVTLDASDNTRIRSVPGARSWAGVAELPLPMN